VESLDILQRIEQHYDLPKGYFKSKLPHPGRAPTGCRANGVTAAELRRLAWHLPDDFNNCPEAERQEILHWVRTVVISGTTDYRRYQAAAMKLRYAIRFPSLTGRKVEAVLQDADEFESSVGGDPEWLPSTVDAPSMLAEEMSDLVRFKSATLTDIGFQRTGVWGEETSAQKIEHLGLMFGALAASPDGAISGLGVALPKLCFAMLIFPKVWDWYVRWRESRRGFYTCWEVDMLQLGKALVRRDTGWLRQNPRIADRLCPIDDLISAEDIDEINADWHLACDTLHAHLSARAKEVEHVARVHRDPFEPILPILEADSPVGEYRKITDEILGAVCIQRIPFSEEF